MGGCYSRLGPQIHSDSDEGAVYVAPEPKQIKLYTSSNHRSVTHATEFIQENSGLPWFEFLGRTELCTMNYDGLATSPETRLAHLVRMLENLLVPKTLRISVEDMIPFVIETQAGMPTSNYHTAAHVADVCQCMYSILLATNLAQRLQPLELSAAFVAALCHDLEHPGLSNNHHAAHDTGLARQHGDQSTNELHHVAQFRFLCEKHDILRNLNFLDSRRFVHIVQSMIMATDMSLHSRLLTRMSTALDDDLNPLQDVVMLLQVALKCADISNQVRPFEVALKWNNLAYSEFYAEGDLAREAGFELARINDRKNNVIEESTAVFVGGVVKPLFAVYVDVLKRCAEIDPSIDFLPIEECLIVIEENMGLYHEHERTRRDQWVKPVVRKSRSRRSRVFTDLNAEQEEEIITKTITQPNNSIMPRALAYHLRKSRSNRLDQLEEEPQSNDCSTTSIQTHDEEGVEETKDEGSATPTWTNRLEPRRSSTPTDPLLNLLQNFDAPLKQHEVTTPCGGHAPLKQQPDEVTPTIAIGEGSSNRAKAAEATLLLQKPTRLAPMSPGKPMRLAPRSPGKPMRSAPKPKRRKSNIGVAAGGEILGTRTGALA